MTFQSPGMDKARKSASAFAAQYVAQQRDLRAKYPNKDCCNVHNNSYTYPNGKYYIKQQFWPMFHLVF